MMRNGKGTAEHNVRFSHFEYPLSGQEAVNFGSKGRGRASVDVDFIPGVRQTAARER
jgi:hypothetical protein